MMKVLVVVLGGVGEKGGKAVLRMVGGEGVAKGAVVAVETTVSLDGEKSGDGGSPDARVIAAVTVYKNSYKLLRQY